MIATIFSKTRPFNYILIGLLLVLFFVLFGFCQNLFDGLSATLVLVATFVLIAGTIFLTSFIGLRNNLTKNNTYAILFCLLFTLMFPQVFQNVGLVFSNFLVLLAIRRLVAVQSLKNIKQKIFDASMLIFMASLFQFWAILFILLVFVIIVFFAVRDYRNWIIPIIALAATVVLFVFFALLFEPVLVANYFQNQTISTNIDYFSNTFQNISFSVFLTLSLLFFTSLVFSYTKKPMADQALFRLIMLSFLLAIAVFVLSPEKNNSLLIYAFAPLAIMASNYFENIQTNWIAQVSAGIITILAITCFVGQL